MQITVVGGGVFNPEACETAWRLGQPLASRGHILLSANGEWRRPAGEPIRAGV